MEKEKEKEWKEWIIKDVEFIEFIYSMSTGI